jgi:hypothetical protein
MDNSFYTYAYLREDGTPYYIGKGKGGRAFHPYNRNAPCPPKERILFLKTGLSEEEAFRHEMYMIAVFGRKDLGTGILRNLTDGGEGPSNPSAEVREKMGRGRRGKPGPWNGKKHSEETKKKMSEIHKANPSLGMLGKTHTKETKEKMSATAKSSGKVMPSFEGNSHLPETRQRISEKLKGRQIAPEHLSARIGKKRGPYKKRGSCT